MNEQLENSENDFLWKLLANPADPSHSYIYNLQLVVSDHPQSGLLRALLVPKGDEQHLKNAAAYFNPRILFKMTGNLDGLAEVTDEQIVFAEESTYMPRTYVNPMADPFAPPIVDDSETNYFHVEDAETHVVKDVDEPAETPETYTEEEPSSETEAYETPDEDEVYEEITPHDELPNTVITPAVEEQPLAETASEELLDEETGYPWYIDQEETPVQAITTHEGEKLTEEDEYPWYTNEEAEDTLTEHPLQKEVKAEEEELLADDSLLAKEYEEHLARIMAANANVPYYTFDDEEEETEESEPIEDEVYEEIVSIEDIGLEQLAILNKTAQNESAGEQTIAAEPGFTETEEYTAEPTDDEESEDDGVRHDNTSVTEHDEAVQTQPVSYQEPVAQASPVTAIATIAAANSTKTSSSQRVSRYNDEKMPYSFMWWLDKTRKEHANVYQPYGGDTPNMHPPAAKQEAPEPQNLKPVLGDELQQQYFENIFNANSINGLDPLPPKNAVVPEPAVRKEDKIIERFIQEEPQIKHPSTVKLNSENKAKKSSEDRDELVTETLAKIYTEQMLYHKAINTYKKLMLKYPEKSLYFAGQIEQLEKKIN